MRRDKRLVPRLESLESLVVMSVSAAAMPHAEISALAMKHKLQLSGQVSGTWTTVMTDPDVGASQRLNGSGTVSPLGGVGATGTLHAPGFIAKGRTTGTLTLVDPKGSVTLSLTSGLQKGFSGVAAKYTFTITDATGAYAGDTGKGSAVLSESGGHFRFTFRH